MKLLFLTLLLMMIGCGSAIRDDMPTKELDEDLMRYVDMFIADSEYYSVDLNNVELRVLKKVDYIPHMTDENIHSTYIGLCQKQTLKKKVVDSKGVRTKTGSWNEILILDIPLEPCNMRSLMYHELGHCKMDLEHSDEKSIMTSTTWHSEEVCEKEWDILVEKLFLEGK